MDALPSFATSAYAPFVAMLPVLWLFVSLGVLKWSTPVSCALALAMSIVLAVTGWNFTPELAVKAVLDGALFALLPILWVIFAALLMYSIAVETGAMGAIRELLASISRDRRIQALLIAWGFGGFLEAVAGFGTSVAVPAAILVSLGFAPFYAAFICLMTNIVGAAFGVVGIPVITLGWITDLPVNDLATMVVAQLFPYMIVVPAIIVAIVTGGFRHVAGVWVHVLGAGLSFGVAQYLTVRFIGPELPVVLGSLASFAVLVALARYLPPKAVWTFPHEAGDGTCEHGREVPPKPLGLRVQFRAWSPYIALLVLVLSSRMIGPVGALLGTVTTSHTIYDGPGGKPFEIAWLLTPGTLVLFAAFIGGRIQGASLSAILRLSSKTGKQMSRSVATIICIVALAKILGFSGMVQSVAVALADATGSLYPLVSPFLGMLGTFITGSDTSSNILFGQLQKEVAIAIDVSPVWIAAANTSGASLGKMISLQSIAIAGIAANLAGKEGELLFACLKYAMPFVAVLGGIVYAFA